MYSYSRIKNVLFDKFKEEQWFTEVLSYMMIRYDSIESRMIETFRYVDCNPANYGVFSYEYASILRDVGSIFGSIMDTLVRKSDVIPRKNEYDIRDYRKWLINEIENIHFISVGLNYPIQNRILAPFYRINDEHKKLKWWTAYNKIKHHRSTRYQRANLRNTLNAVAGLFVMLLYLYKEDAEAGTLAPSPSLFRVADEFFAGVDLGSGDVRFVYRL